jgi:pyruvate/2-oxoglutarate dehydrogenase complex dihydrolipoamide dehydrogenase (E3) component
VKVGDVLEVSAPRGDFVLRPGDRPVVLLGAGIGATPLLAMLHELGSTASRREVWWLYGARNRDEHPFAMESRALIKSLPRGRGYICYSRPGTNDRVGQDYDAPGRLALPVLKQLGVPRDADFYLCGPTEFLTSMTCVNTGCTPTKTLVASAYAVHMTGRSAEFGFNVTGPVRVDMKRVKARKDEIVEKSRSSLESWVKNTPNCTVYRGHARFESSNEVSVGEELLTAPQIFINVGGRATIPSMPGVENAPYLTNSTLLDLDVLPRHLVIVGGGYVGLEFGQIFRRFGSEVTIVEKASHLIGHEDEDVSTEVQAILEREGIQLRLNATCIGLMRDGEEVGVRVDCKDGAPEVKGSHLLLAMGRTQNTGDLGLEKAGVACDARGYIPVDNQLRTKVPGIWAIGDCNGRGGFTHTSYNDFEIVAGNLLDHETRGVTDRIRAYNLYIDPPLGRCGMSKHEARASGRHVLIGRRPMTRVGRAVEKGETRGFMEVLVDADSKEILGGTILGTGGDEAIHCVLDMMYARAPYTLMQRAMHIHPTVSELIPTILGELRPL